MDILERKPLPSARHETPNFSKPVANQSDGAAKDVRQDLDTTEAAASMEAATDRSLKKVAPRGKKRKAPDQLPVDRSGKRLSSKSAQEGFKDTIVDQQTLGLKQCCQTCEATSTKIDERKEFLLEFKKIIAEVVQGLRLEESEKANLRLAYVGVKQQLQTAKQLVDKLEKKLDAKESSQTAGMVVSNRDQSIFPLNSNFRTVARSGRTVHGYEDGHIRANTATQPHLQNGMRSSESSYSQRTSLSSMTKT